MNLIMVRILILIILFISTTSFSQNKRLRDHGIRIGILKSGKNNAITDVEGVKVGQTTLIMRDSVRTGVTAILPHSGNIFQLKVPAAIYIGNGFGKLNGYSQVKELGNVETPIVPTNTLSVPVASDALISYSSNSLFDEKKVLRNEVKTPLFLITIEATEEAILNSLFAAKTTTANGHTKVAIPIDKVLDIMKKIQQNKYGLKSYYKNQIPYT